MGATDEDPGSNGVEALGREGRGGRLPDLVGGLVLEPPVHAPGPDVSARMADPDKSVAGHQRLHPRPPGGPWTADESAAFPSLSAQQRHQLAGLHAVEAANRDPSAGA